MVCPLLSELCKEKCGLLTWGWEIGNVASFYTGPQLNVCMFCLTQRAQQ